MNEMVWNGVALLPCSLGEMGPHRGHPSQPLDIHALSTVAEAVTTSITCYNQSRSQVFEGRESAFIAVGKCYGN